MKVLRSSLMVAAAVITAACTKSTTNPPPVTTLVVHSVVVAPSTATLTVGQSIPMTAAVTADAGAVVTPITWTSSDPSKVSVTGTTTTGTVTANLATPGVAICAAVGGATGCATVTVSPAGQVIPATVSIQSVTQNATGFAVTPGSVTGQIDVRVNVSPGNQTVSKIVLLVGSVRADSQTFTAAQAAALRSAADEAIATQSAFPPITFSVNTAKFNALTGVPSWTNAPYTISVQLYVVGNTASTASATWQTPLTFANVNTVALTTTPLAGSKTATSAAGYLYRSGSILASVLPVLYTPGVTMAAGTITFGSAGCDAIGPRTLTLAPTAVGPPATAPWTATFTTGTGTPSAPASATNFKSYEYRTASACGIANIATGEGFTVSGTDNNGNGFLTAAVPANATANFYRMDNVAPGAPSIATNPNGRQNGWINPGAATNAVSLTGAYDAVASPNGWMVNGTADAGVGGYTPMLRIGAPGAGGIADPVGALVSSATPANPAPTVANNSLCAVPTAADKLGNESAVPAAATVCIQPGVAQVTLAAGAPAFLGVDIAPPTIAFSGGLLAGNSGTNGLTAANVGGEFTVTVTDTGIVGNSGMQAGSPVSATVVIRSAAAGLTALQLCPVGTVVSGVCTASSTGFAAPAFPLVSTNTLTADPIIGYYTFTGGSVDAAGNPSTALITRTVAHNPLATNLPTLSAATPGSIPITGPSVTFNALGASGNTTLNGPNTFFDLWKVTYKLAYAGGLVGPLVYPSQSFNSFNGPTMQNNNVPVGITIPAFVRQVEAQTSACNVALTTGGAFKPATLTETLFDQVGNASLPATSTIVGAQVASGTVYTGAIGPLQTWSFILSTGISEAPTVGCQFAAGANAAVKVSTGGASTSADPTTVTLTADVYGPTATYNPLFARVDFYVFVNTNMEQIGSTTSYSTVDDGSTNGRKHRFSFVWTPGAKSPILAFTYVPVSSAACAAASAANLQLYAVGVSAAGDALVTPLNANVCLTNAP